MSYKQRIHNILIIGIVLLIFSFNTLANSGYSQSGDLGLVPAQPESISIFKPIPDQKVSIGNELMISGQSSDSVSKDCTVSVIVNNIKPYQKADPTGAAGSNDYSEWRFVLRENYTDLIEGQNKITAKLLCTSAPTRWYSVFVNGVTTSETSIETPQTSTSSSGNDDQNMLSSLQTGQESNVPPTILPGITANNNYNALMVSISSLKNPVARGDTQNITITVTNSNYQPILDAEIDGKLIYPGDNYEKDFSGSTDANGKFLYSWTIGENGDIGPLNIKVDASSPAYEAQSVTSSFGIVAPSDSSVVNNNVSYNPSIQKDGFDFVVAGDYGCDSRTRETINAMGDKNPDLVLALGDLSEIKDPDCFFNLFSKIDDEGKLKIVLGEHDTDSDDEDDSSSRFSQYVRHFDLAKPFYSYDYQNIHFLAMSTGKEIVIPYAVNSIQYNFVNSDLARASNDDKIDWIIVYGYRPFYSSPTIHPSQVNLRNAYPPLFEKYGVDLVITSHNHNYQRTYPLLSNNQSPKDPIVKDRNSTDYNNPNAPIYVTVGTAGGNLYDLLGQAPFVANQFKNSGFLNVDIKNKDRQLNATFHNSNDGIDEDQFSIIKS